MIRILKSSAAAVTLIYVVDDAPCLRALYTALLERAGYKVSTFSDRAQALTALKAEPCKPDLLITDYLGFSMPVEPFMEQCRLVHPSLRILMASGVNVTDLQFSLTAPDRFIQKPFSIGQLQNEVSAALAA